MGALIAVIEPLYPTSGRVGRQPMGVSKMLRMYLLQQWYGLADEALEDAIYDSQALRDFVGIDLSRESVPDATTLLKFRRLLLAGDLTKAMFEEINAHLAQQGLLMRAGTIVDATIIAAPSSTKNASNERDPEMHQAKKGNQWHFGMKAHIGVDAESGIVHTVVATAANVNDVTQAGALLHGRGDRRRSAMPATAACTSAKKRKARSGTSRCSPASAGCSADSALGQMLEKAEQIKASIRAKVEHPFHVVKNLFRHKKARYKGLAKNHAQLLQPVRPGQSGDRQEAVAGHPWPEVRLDTGQWACRGPKNRSNSVKEC